MSDAATILVLATGGTIAGTASDPSAGGYVAGGVAIETLLAGTPGTSRQLALRWQTIASVGSQDMDVSIWQRLIPAIEEGFASGEVDGMVVTHGTDTLEESAFLLDLVLPRGRPVVLVGAMRPGNAIGADGPRNLINALHVASDPASRDRGVLAVVGDEIFPAGTVRKARTSGTDAFRSFPGGPVGSVSPSSLRYFAGPPTDPAHALALQMPRASRLPSVAILYGHADMEPATVSAILAVDGLRGLVLAGVGHGNAPRDVLATLATAAAQGLAVVRSTRIDEGEVAQNLEIDDDAHGFIVGGALSPQKCRLLLQLLLANGVVGSGAIQRAFDGAQAGGR